MKHGVLFVLSILLFIALTLPAVAQEVTPQPDVPPNESETATIPVDYLWSVENRSNIALIVVGLAAVLLGGGGILAVSLVSKNAAEKLFLSAPPEHQRTMLSVIGFVDALAKELANVTTVLKEVTDGKPNDAPNPPQQLE